MSSGEEDINDGEAHGSAQELKKRRIQRACDICRRKKVRCDGGQMPNNRCSNCIAYNLDCTYVEAAKKRGPPKGYVESLENRLENMEKLLQRLCPDADFTQELGSHVDRDSWAHEKRPSDTGVSARASRSTSPSRLTTSATPMSGGIPGLVDLSELPPSDDEMGNATLTEGLKRLAVEPLDRRFHGKSSGVMLVQAAMNLKREISGVDAPKDLIIASTRRPEFWAPHPWEMINEEHMIGYRYPPDDLIPDLVNSYFAYVNPFLPVLHRPSFERALNDRRHHTDVGFGSVVMLVCAIGARYFDDPRVFIEGMSKHSSGWKWFEQVQIYRKSFLGPPRLYDLQIYALSSIFLYSSSSPQSSWTMAGIGVRLAQDVGAHRRKVYNAPLSVESELWKRAFWVLVALDRFSSAALGRPCAIQDEDFDLDLPLEVDDEYWEHLDPAQAFKQPPDVPCIIAYFNSFLKLNQILAFALRTIYSINKSKVLLGFVGPQWEQHIVAELDSALNKWIDSVPDHLRWDPHRENLLHFSQSATLYAAYYHIQILIHRPFIPSPRKPSPLTFPSLAICTNAARSCSHVADIQRRRGSLPLPQIQVAVFTAGIVLLLNIWGAKKSGSLTDPAKQMADVHKCMDVLHCIEERWISAGRLWDILNELASVGDIPLDKSSTPSNKRERGADSPLSAASPGGSQLSVPSTLDPATRPIAGRRSVSSIPACLPTIPQTASSVAAQEMRPFGTNHLPASKGGILPGVPPSNNVPLSWMHPQSNQPPAVGTSADVFTSTGMPNLNIFDLFQSDSQMFNMSMVDQTSFNEMPAGQAQPAPQQHQQQVVGVQKIPQRYDPTTMDHAAQLQEAFGALDGSMPSVVNEALQMWSSAPTSFDMEDWGSYLNQVNGATSDSHHSSPNPQS